MGGGMVHKYTKLTPMHNNLYYRIGSGWYQPLSQGFRRRAALLLYALLGAVVGPTGAMALAAYAATPPPLV